MLQVCECMFSTIMVVWLHTGAISMHTNGTDTETLLLLCDVTPDVYVKGYDISLNLALSMQVGH